MVIFLGQNVNEKGIFSKLENAGQYVLLKTRNRIDIVESALHISLLLNVKYKAYKNNKVSMIKCNIVHHSLI